jgi:hypothetical protein
MVGCVNTEPKTAYDCKNGHRTFFFAQKPLEIKIKILHLRIINESGFMTSGRREKLFNISCLQVF